jgi:hypothetical protein
MVGGDCDGQVIGHQVNIYDLIIDNVVLNMQNVVAIVCIFTDDRRI